MFSTAVHVFENADVEVYVVDVTPPSVVIKDNLNTIWLPLDLAREIGKIADIHSQSIARETELAEEMLRDEAGERTFDCQREEALEMSPLGAHR